MRGGCRGANSGASVLPPVFSLGEWLLLCPLDCQRLPCRSVALGPRALSALGLMLAVTSTFFSRTHISSAQTSDKSFC